MPTVLDELVFLLNVDTTGLKAGSQSAKDFTNSVNKFASDAIKGLSAIEPSARKVTDYLEVMIAQFAAINQNMVNLGSQSRRSGQAIQSGFAGAAAGVRALTAAALGAYASIKSIQNIFKNLGGAAASGAQTGRAAYFTNLPVQWLSAFEQYAFKVGNVPKAATEGALNQFEQARTEFKTKGTGPFADMIAALGRAGITTDVNEPLETLIPKIATALRGRNGSEVQFYASQLGLDALKTVLAQGGANINKGIAEHTPTALTQDQVKALTDLQGAINDVSSSWQHLVDVFITSNPEFTDLLRRFNEWLKYLANTKEGLAAVQTAAEIFAGVVAVTMVRAVVTLANVIIAQNARILATPLGRLLLGAYLLSQLGGDTSTNPEEQEYNKQHFVPTPGAVDPRNNKVVRSVGPNGQITYNDGSTGQGPADNRTWWQKVAPERWGGKPAPSVSTPSGTGPQGQNWTPPTEVGGGIEANLRASAIKYGLNPDDVVNVAKAEGLNSPFKSWDVNGYSYGALQMHQGGLADEFEKATGLKADDPKNQTAMNDWAIRYASQHGWGKWSSVTGGRVAAPRTAVGGMATGAGAGGPAAAVDDMIRMAGLDRADPRVRQFLQRGGESLDPRFAAWCAAFLTSAFKQEGIGGTKGDIATSWSNYGTPETGPVQKGDVVVLNRGLGPGQTGGHVGLATGEVDDQGRIRMIAGNTGGKVDYQWVDPTQVTVRHAMQQQVAMAANPNYMRGGALGGSGTAAVNNDNDVNIHKIDIHTQATDAHQIAYKLGGALRSHITWDANNNAE